MADVKIQIYGIRTVEDARMVIEMGAHHIGVSYGKIKRTPGQLTLERAKEIFEGVQPEAVKIGLTIAEDIEEITENLKEVLPDVLHLSGNIEGISPEQVRELPPREKRFYGISREIFSDMEQKYRIRMNCYELSLLYELFRRIIIEENS